MMKWLGYVVVLLIAVFFGLVAVFNSQSVAFDYVFGQRELPLILIMVLSFVGGALLAMIIFGTKAAFWRSRSQKLQSQLDYEHRTAHEEAVKNEYQADVRA